MVRPAVTAMMLLAAGRMAWGAAPQAPVALTAGAASSETRSAGALSPTALSADLPLLPASPKRKPAQANVAWEDFTVVTLISLPFTAIWCGLAAALVSGLSNGRLPLNSKSPLVAGAACTAGAASVGIGLVSVSWGGPRNAAPGAAPATTPGAAPVPAPAAAQGVRP